MKLNNKKGFTLAEVLLTLTVVGIIASLTIPNLIISVQKQQFTAALKKTCSTLTQAGITLAQSHGGEISKDLSNYSYCMLTKSGVITWWPYNCPYETLGDYLSIAKSCGNGAAQGCWHEELEILSLDGLVIDEISSYNWASGTAGRSAVIADGTLIRFQWFNDDPDQTHLFVFVVDVNGFKGPNTYGKDIFVLDMDKYGNITTNTTYSYTNDSSSNCSTSCSESWKICGSGCAHKIILNSEIDWY